MDAVAHRLSCFSLATVVMLAMGVRRRERATVLFLSSRPAYAAVASLWRRPLATQEGLHVGYLAAANACAAAHLFASGRLPAEAVAVTVLCDTGLKY